MTTRDAMVRAAARSLASSLYGTDIWGPLAPDARQALEAAFNVAGLSMVAAQKEGVK